MLVHMGTHERRAMLKTKIEEHLCALTRARGALANLERVAGIEPAYSAWKAAALPLSYTRTYYSAVRAKRTGTTVTFSTAHKPYQNQFRFWLVHQALGSGSGGGGWIRTNVSQANGFTVRPL